MAVLLKAPLAMGMLSSIAKKDSPSVAAIAVGLMSAYACI